MTKITQQLAGVDAGATVQTTQTEAEKATNLNCEIYGASVFRHFENGVDRTVPKDTDDMIVIGSTYQGLPFQLVIDGFFGCERDRLFAFVNTKIVDLMDEFALKLRTEDNSDVVIQALINRIYELRRGTQLDFTMSAAITYQKSKNVDDLHCAGFGIGDTGLLLQRHENSHIEQLAFTTVVNEFKDAFDDYSARNIGDVITRNSIFNTAIKRGDEIVGYTYLFDELMQKERTYQINTDLYASQHSLVTQPFFRGLALCPQLRDLMMTKFREKSESAVTSNQSGKFGDDFMLGSFTVPTRQLQLSTMLDQCVENPAYSGHVLPLLSAFSAAELYNIVPNAATISDSQFFSLLSDFILQYINCRTFFCQMQHYLEEKSQEYFGGRRYQQRINDLAEILNHIFTVCGGVDIAEVCPPNLTTDLATFISTLPKPDTKVTPLTFLGVTSSDDRYGKLRAMLSTIEPAILFAAYKEFQQVLVTEPADDAQGTPVQRKVLTEILAALDKLQPAARHEPQ